MSYLAQLKRLESEKISINTPEAVLTELTKDPSVSFGSTVQGAYEKNNAEKVGTGDTGAIRAWLALIEETDPAIIADVLARCERDPEARDYFTGRAAEELPKLDPFHDDRRTCDQCANLIARRCQAAKRGEIVASRNYEPIRDLPRRCEGYAPGAADADRRSGCERWPGMTDTKGGK